MRASRALEPSERLRTAEQFAAVAAERATWRAARQWIAAAARIAPQSGSGSAARISGDSVEHPASTDQFADRFDSQAGVRFGFTVGRRQARRAVQRVMVKRVLREAARHAAPMLRPLVRQCSVDVVMRLRSSLPEASQMGLAELKRSLRAEADSLIAQLARHLRAGQP